MVFATFAVRGPRSRSYTTPLGSTMKVITPDERYSAGYAMKEAGFPRADRARK
jgi:hypothetical protein